MDLSSKQVMVFNGGFQPIGKVSAERAICLIYLGKAYSIKDTDKVVRSAKFELNIPEYISIPNAKYIKPRKQPFTKRAMLERDGYKCVYCGENARGLLTKDHIIPRTRWAEESKKRGITYELDSFENCVTACLYCNQTKSSKLLSELGWKEIVGEKPLDSLEIDWSSMM